MKKRIFAAAAAAICLLTCVSCGKEAEISVNENVSGNTSPSGTADNTAKVGDVVEPKEGSEEYDLGSYRVASDGVKFYYEEPISEELMFALDNYFTTFQNEDFEAYQELIYPDYKERYSTYLQDEYEYGLEDSFKLNCENLRAIMQSAVAGDEGDSSQYTGDFTITRIKAEQPELSEGETLDDLKADLFSYFDEIFDTDYYEFVKANSDEIEYVSFYIYAMGEDGTEHRLISGYEIAFAVVDGKYYTFG
ncbi:MAG: hypothetical protein J6U16_06825 [Ruminococcus sp.]|nr:hypothetical protein [Ruminococcus sp.]